MAANPGQQIYDPWLRDAMDRAKAAGNTASFQDQGFAGVGGQPAPAQPAPQITQPQTPVLFAPPQQSNPTGRNADGSIYAPLPGWGPNQATDANGMARPGTGQPTPMWQGVTAVNGVAVDANGNPIGGNPTSRGTSPVGGYGAGNPGSYNSGFQFDPNSFGSAGRFQIDPALEQAYRFALNQGMQRYQTANNQFYQGPTVAGLTPDEQNAQNMIRGASGQMQPMIGQVGDYYKSLLSQPGQANPALEAAIQAMQKSAMTSFQDPGGPMANIRNDSMSAGQYGGTRQGIAEGVAMGRLGDALTGNEANMRMQDLTNQYSRASGAASALPSYLQSMMAPGAALSGVGAQNREIEQANMNSGLNAWAYENTIPDTRIQNLINSIGGTMPLGGTNYSQQYSPSWYTDLLKSSGGAAGGSGNNILAAIAAAAGLYNTFK